MRGYLFGYPISHSLSPFVYGALFADKNISLDYSSLEIKNINEARKALHELIDEGERFFLNVTSPLKEAMFDLLCDSQNGFKKAVIEENAIQAGGVNVLSFKDGILSACNTDGAGAAFALERKIGSLSGKKALICGTGPCARSIANAFAEKGASVAFVSINPEQTQSKLRFLSVGYKDAYRKAQSVDIIVNATVLGMNKDDESPLLPEAFVNAKAALEAVYASGTTAFEKAAQSAKVDAVVSGVEMLVAQAIAACHAIGAYEGVLDMENDTNVFDEVLDKINR
ncbi:MAG: hypothetical protein J6Y65_01575 [Eggerthellaceae bacterium]|nr:hypothetical protein [Eggerthellaceae bacterium]